MPRPKRRAECHPEKQNFGHGLCQLCYYRDYKKKNPPKIYKYPEYLKQWYQDNKDHCKVNNKRNHYLREYGLTLEQRDEMLKEQNSLCKLCKIDLTNPVVDHDHKTGRIRGLLCSNCNLALGLFNDKIQTLKNAVEYLK